MLELLLEFANQDLNLANVNTITIGFGTKNAPPQVALARYISKTSRCIDRRFGSM